MIKSCTKCFLYFACGDILTSFIFIRYSLISFLFFLISVNINNSCFTIMVFFNISKSIIIIVVLIVIVIIIIVIVIIIIIIYFFNSAKFKYCDRNSGVIFFKLLNVFYCWWKINIINI